MENFFTIKAVAKKLNVSVKTLRRWEKTGKFLPHHIGQKNTKFYSQLQIDEMSKMMLDTSSKNVHDVQDNVSNMSNVQDDLSTMSNVDVQHCPPSETAGKKNSADDSADQNFVKKNSNTEKEQNQDSKDKFSQHLENLPLELLAQNRFFPVHPNKTPAVSGWQEPQNQSSYSDALKLTSFVGFDCTGRDGAANYCLVDFDHCLQNATFVNEDVADIYNFIVKNCNVAYCELSISGTGLHFLLKPTSGKFPKITNSRQGVFYFDDLHDVKTSPKMELFYLNGARYCFFTGKVFNCLPNAPIPQGDVADSTLSILLDLIKAQIDKETEKTHTDTQNNKSTSRSYSKNFGDCPSEQERAIAMLDCIPCSKQTYGDWLAVGMCLKNNGNSLADWESWSATDSARYKVGECEKKWNGFKGGGVTIATLHKFAQWYGYSEKEFRRQWYKDHPDAVKGNAWTNSNFAQGTQDNLNDENDNSATDDEGTPKLDDTDKFALFSLPHSDLYNSRRILIFHGKNIRFATDSGKWFTYNNKDNVWADGGKENTAVLPFALNVADLIYHNADSAEETGSEEKLKKLWQARKTISNAVELLKGEDKIRITEQDLNTHKNLLNCKNGVIDLQTGKLYKHNSKLLLTQCVNAEYRKGYHNDIVDNFLRDVLPDTETLQALLRYLGYCLTGEVRAEKALFIHGLGGNGKGTLTKLLFNLFGDFACGFPIEAILMQSYNRTDGDSATPAFNKLQWRRLAIAEEIPAGRKLDYAKFKILTGGDALPIRKLHQEATEIKDPVHKFIFSGNHLPELDDAHDPGILRRWIQIKFEQDFTGDKGDETLKQRLQTKDALSAMLNLLVENAVDWYKDGLFISDKMKTDRDNYFADNDFISDFISEFCVRGDGLSTKRKDFLEQLKNEYPNETRGKSDQELTSVVSKIEGISYKRIGGTYRFYNIGLRDLQ